MLNSLLFIISILILTIGNLLRFGRWNLLCNSAHIYQTKTNYNSYFLGRCLNLFVPLKLGDMIRFLPVKQRDQLLPMLLLFCFERTLDLLTFFTLVKIYGLNITFDQISIAATLTITIALALVFSFARIHLVASSTASLSIWSLKRIVSRKIALILFVYSGAMTLCVILGNIVLSLIISPKITPGNLLAQQLEVSSTFNLKHTGLLLIAIFLSCVLPIALHFIKPNLFGLDNNELLLAKKIGGNANLATFEISNPRRFAKILLLHDEKIQQVFNGGSNAITYLTLSSKGYRVRKSAREVGMNTLKKQFEYMRQFSSHNQIPSVSIDQDSSDYFGYSMEYYGDFETLSQCIENTEISASVFVALVSDYLSVFYEKIALSESDLNLFFQEKKERLVSRIETLRDHETLTSQSWEIFQKDIAFAGEFTKKYCRSKGFSKSHGDFSSGNILYDGNSFRYIDLLPPSQQSSVESDWGKLYLSLLIDLEKRIQLQNQDASFLLTPPRISRKGIEVATTFLAITEQSSNAENIIAHALLHFVRVLPYRIDDGDSASYWLGIFHETIVFFKEKYPHITSP